MTFIEIISTLPPPLLESPILFSPLWVGVEGFTLWDLILSLLCVTNLLPSPYSQQKGRGLFAPLKGSAPLVGNQSTNAFLWVISCPEKPALEHRPPLFPPDTGPRDRTFAREIYDIESNVTLPTCQHLA